jgi:hypothetical protein
MITVSIKEKDIFKIEEADKTIHYGSNQEWYAKKWQRLSGCGPSTVANIIHYLNSRRNDLSYGPGLTKKECLDLMEEIWNFVTPGLGGVSSTDMLGKGVQKYLDRKKLNIRLGFLDIPKKPNLRPNLQQVIRFLDNALEKDSPVAFLNLEHGDAAELDSWHWVTIISMEYGPEADIAFVTILDGGLEKRINLSGWLETTKLGGGFVSFEPE